MTIGLIDVKPSINKFESSIEVEVKESVVIVVAVVWFVVEDVGSSVRRNATSRSLSTSVSLGSIKLKRLNLKKLKLVKGIKFN